MKRLRFFQLLFISMLFPCTENPLCGKGSKTVQYRSVSAFTGIESHYGIGVETGDSTIQHITPSGYESLLEAIEDTRVNESFKFSSDGNFIKECDKNKAGRIHLPLVNKATIHGITDILIDDVASRNGSEGMTESRGRAGATVAIL